MPVDCEQPAARRRARSGRTISPRNAGCGRTTPAGARRRRSPSSAPKLRPAVHRQMRRRLFLGMVLVEDLALPERRARRRSRPPTPGSSSPTGFPSVLAGVTDPRWSSAASAPPATRRSTRDDWGGLPDKEFLAALDPRLAELARPALRTAPTTRREPAGSLCSGMGGEARAARRHPDRDRRVRRPLRRDRLRRARGHAGQGDRHLDLRLRGRLGRQAGRRHSRHLRHRQGRHPARLFRHRGRPVGGRRHLQMVGRGRSAAATPRCTPN